MAYDYSSLVSTVTDLVERFGRPVDLVKFDPDSDSAAPWRDEAGSEEVLAPTHAVFVPPSDAYKFSIDDPGLSGLIAKSDQMVYTAFSGDATKYSVVRDSTGKRWAIRGMQELAPGPTNIMWIIGVSE